MRIPVRSLAALLLCAGVATCSDTPIAAVKQGPGPNSRAGFGRVALGASFSKTASYVAAHAEDFGIAYDSVHLRIRGTPDTTAIVKDTVIHFTRTSADTSIDLLVPVQADGQKFDAAIAYENNGQVVFSGHAVVQSYPPGGSPPPNQGQITINYVGPGSKVAKIEVRPKVSVIFANQTTPFSVTASDSNGATVASPPIAWSSSDESVGHVSANGVFAPTGKRGTVTVTAITPTGLSDNASASVLLQAASITLVSGGGQSGAAGSTLPSPAIVQVIASDGVGVSGVNVIFSAPAGGSVGTTSTTTDGSGRASTTLRLGTAAGPQSFAATSGAFAVGIPETATAGQAASIAALSGGGQVDTVRHALRNPLVVHVADSYNNAVSGATVSWTKTGGGSLSGASSVTGADGKASIGYTLGSTPGSETISASVGGVTGAVSFTETAVAAAPANIAIVSGGIQTGTVNAPLDAPFVVQVTDIAGNPVQGAVVHWSATSGSIAATSTTDASGQASQTLTLAKTAGGVTVTATIANGHGATFNVTGQPGVTAGLQWQVQPSNTVAGAAISPALQVAVVDLFGNRTSLAQPITLSLRGGSGDTTLAGTVTRTPASGVATFNDIVVNRAGSAYTLIAKLGGLSFTATSASFNVSAAAAASLAISAGDNQTATVNTAVATPPAVRITDGLGNPIAGVSVTFAPASGSGTVAAGSSTATTNVLGVAALTSWTLGQTAGAQSLVASAAGLPSVTFHATAQAGSAAGLQWRVQPSNVKAAAVISPSPQVAIVDAFGNQVSSTATITLALSGGASGAKLGGTVTRAAVAGVATFNDLNIDLVGSAYALTASGTGVSSNAVSSTFTVSAGAANTVSINAGDNQTTAVNTAVATAPSVRVVDASNNPVAGVAVTFTAASGSGSVSPNSGAVTTDAQGVAALTSWTLGTTAGPQLLTASATGLPSVTFHATAQGGAAAALKITTQPSSSATSGAVLAQQPVIQVVDQFGNAVPAGTMQVTASASSGTLAGTNPVTANATTGIATFTDLKITGTGSVTLAFASSIAGVQGATSNSISLASSGPTQLVLVPSSPTTFTFAAGAPPTLPGVKALDAAGAGVSGVPIHVAVTLGGVTAAVKDTVTGADGTVGAPAAAIPTVAGSYTVTLTSSAIPGASASFTENVNAGNPAKLAFATQPSNVVATSPITPAIVVQVEDQFGNVVGGATNSVSLASTPSVALSGTTTVTATNGNATFSNVSVGTAGAYTLTATSSGLAAATSSSFNVSASSAATIDVSSTAALTLIAGTTLASPPTLTVKDGSGNPIAGASVTISIKQGTATVGTPRVLSTNALGQVTVGSLVAGDYPTTAGSYTIVASSGSLSSTGVTLSVVAATPTKLSFSGQPSTVAAGASISPAIKVQVLDAFNNVATTSSAPMALAIHGTSSATLSGGAAVSAVNGEATFTAVSINLVGAYQLDATSTGLTTATSSSFSVTAGSAASITLSSSSALSITAGGALTSAPIATLNDGSGNPVAGGSITLTVKSGSTTIGTPKTFTTNALGQVGLDSLKAGGLPTTAGSYTIIPSSGSVTNAGVTLTVNPGSAASIAAINYNAATGYTLAAGAAATSPPGVQVKDTYGNGVSGVQVIAVTTITGASTVVRRDTLTTGATGSVNLSGLSTTLAGAYTVTATSGTLSGSPLTFSVTITAAAANQLVFSVQPTSVNAGVTISPAIKVQVKDSFGNLVTSSSAPIGLAIHGSTTATLTGGGAVSAVSGEATFSGVNVNLAGTYQLDATSTGLTSATSSAFTVSAGTVASLAFVSGHSANGSVADNDLFSPTLQVKALDAGGNPVSNITIDASVDAPSVGASVFRRPPGPAVSDAYFGRTLPAFSGGTTLSARTDASGIADFGAAKMRGAVQSFRVLFTARGTSLNLETGNISLNHGAPSTANCSNSSLPGHVRLGHRMSSSALPSLVVRDIDGNLVTLTSVTLTNTGGSLSSNTVTTDDGGTAAPTSWTVGTTDGATNDVGVSATTGTKCSTIAVAAHTIKLIKHVDGTAVSALTGLKNGDPIPDIDATVVDAAGDPIEDEAFAISVVGNSHSGKTISIGVSDVTDKHGAKSFTGLVVDAQAQSGATLDYSVSGLTGVTAQVSFDVADGSDAALDVVGNGGSTTYTVLTDHTYTSLATVTIKDHNKRNSKATPGVTLTWTLSDCTQAGFGGITGATSATSTTATSGQAIMPSISIGVGFPTVAGTCTVTVSGTSGSTTLTPLTLTLNLP